MAAAVPRYEEMTLRYIAFSGDASDWDLYKFRVLNKFTLVGVQDYLPTTVGEDPRILAPGEGADDAARTAYQRASAVVQLELSLACSGKAISVIRGQTNGIESWKAFLAHYEPISGEASIHHCITFMSLSVKPSASSSHDWKTTFA
jgi:hypothetical protein